MEWVKTTAKTLPEAIDLALDNLGVDESEAEIVVLEEPRPGLFGRMRGTARVEARVKPKPIRPKNERNRNRRNRNDDNKRSRNRTGNKGGNRGGRQGSGERSGAQGGRDDESTPRSGQEAAVGGRGERSEQQGDGRSKSRNRRRRRGGGGGGQQGGHDGDRHQDDGAERAPADQNQGRPRSNGGGEAKASEGASVEEVATHLRTFLTELNEAFGFDSDVTVDDSEEGTLVGRIEGRHGLLVGPKGRTLDAVQELARISCQRTAPSSVRIKVDVGGYRDQRAAALADFATAAADRAASEGVEVAMEPMSPADRKSVHDALNDDDRVETRSVGTEPRRRVVVVPLEIDDDDEELDVAGAATNGAAVDGDDELTEVEDSDAVASDDEE